MKDLEAQKARVLAQIDTTPYDPETLRAVSAKTERIRKSFKTIYELAAWQADDAADPNNESPEDMTAHVNGLIRQECNRALNQLDVL